MSIMAKAPLMWPSLLSDPLRIRTDLLRLTAIMKTCLDLRAKCGGDFDAFYFLASGNDWYLSGVYGLGDRSSSVAAIRRLRERYKKCVFVGNSMGGHAAIRFGIPSGADKIIAFSPQVRLDSAFRMEHGDKRWQSAIAVLQERYPPADLSLEAVLADVTNLPEIAIYAGELCPQDVAQAECLKNYPKVTLHLESGADHDLVHSLREQGKLGSIIGDAITSLLE